ncbi:MAG: ABC transporter permease, partial [Promethearchaeota archaeon]
MANEIIEGILEAIRLIFTFDPEVWGIIEVSFRVSLTSTFLAALVALPIGSYIGLREFRGKKELSNLINTFMGFPPVVMGLMVYLLLSRNGPLGSLGLLYSTTAMIIAQFLLAIPIIM